MSKELLLKSASALKQPNAKLLEEYSQKLNLLINKVNALMLQRADVNDMVGESNIEMMKDNHSNHARFMESTFMNYEPQVLVDTVLWVFRAYRSRNFSSTYWAAQLNGWFQVYKQELSPELFAEIEPFYKWMQVNIPIFNALAELDIEAPLSSH